MPFSENIEIFFQIWYYLYRQILKRRFLFLKKVPPIIKPFALVAFSILVVTSASLTTEKKPKPTIIDKTTSTTIIEKIYISDTSTEESSEPKNTQETTVESSTPISETSESVIEETSSSDTESETSESSTEISSETVESSIIETPETSEVEEVIPESSENIVPNEEVHNENMQTPVIENKELKGEDS